MKFVRLRSLMFVSGLAATMAAGCGQTPLSSPTGPSGSLGGAALTDDGVASTAPAEPGSGTITTLRQEGKGKGSGGTEESQNGKNEEKEQGKPEPGTRGALSGFVTAADGTSLTVRGITVTPGPEVVIRHGNRLLLFADIVVGDHVQARGTMDGAALVASEIKVEQTGKGDDSEGELKGAISGLTSTAGCPVLTFTVGTTVVTTSAATEFDGVLCTALADGAIVEVEGTPQPDGSILATKVELEDDEEDSDEDAAKVEGLVSGLPGSGTCPTLTFTVGTTQVTTTAATTFKDVTCATLANDMTVEVKGVLQIDGSVVASKVELD